VSVKRRSKAIWLAATVALLLALGFTYEELGRRADAKRLARVGRPVDVGGRTLNICMMGRGAPAVVLIPGAGTPGISWSAIQEQIAKTTLACWVDRAGEGWSDPAPFPLTSAADARDLHAALHRAGVAPPYVLVGHSLGGLDARVFAGLYASEMAGMVLVDSAHEEEPLRAPKAYIGHSAPRWLWHPLHLAFSAAARFGVIRLARRPAVGRVEALQNSPRAVASWSSRGLVAPDSYAEAHASGGIGARPLIVLTRGRLPSSSDREILAYESVWQHELQPKLLRLSTNSRQVIVQKSGHGIPDDAPDAVVEAIKRVLEQVR
jgi:pimeloyl-ACP methyl ester carboxylesterase